MSAAASDLKSVILELIRRSSTDYPASWQKAMENAAGDEVAGSSAKAALETIVENIKLARADSAPICQDTGFLTFYVDYPAGGREADYITAIQEGVKEATARQYLRPNAVDVITGKNTENNVGKNAPNINFHQWDKPEVRIRVLQKGGGCENCTTQYKLPDSELGAGRDFKGIRKVVLDAVVKAQGQGCAPGILGIAVGGDRTASYKLAKEQLFRDFGQRSEIPEVAELEKTIFNEANELGIGPMGFGGKTTVLEAFVDTQHRHPATYYVSVVYDCWAYRNGTVTLKGDEVVYG